MKKSLQPAVTAVAVLMAVAGTAVAWSMARRAGQAERENESLRRQIVALQTAAEVFISDMEAEDAPVAGELVVLQELLQEPAATEASGREPALTYLERMEQLSIEDPGQYEKVIAKTEERQQKLKYYLAERTALFVDLDTSLMTDKELESHNLLVDRMGEVWELMGQMKHPSESDNRELLKEMTVRMRRMEPLLKKERNTMLKLMAHELGYGKQDARTFTDRVNAIYDYTTLNNAKFKKP